MKFVQTMGTCLMGVAMVLAGSAWAGPYPPQADKAGTTAIPVDHEGILSWATGFQDYVPGADVIDIWRTPHEALGRGGKSVSDIVALGRGGKITVTFDGVISDRDGWDFAVFENSFNHTFLELGFVEVSSDGKTFIRFATDSRTGNPVHEFGKLDPTNVDGFAGKYQVGFGTPFDLADLKNRQEVVSGRVDLSAIRFVRIQDVVGDGSVTDTAGNVIYDPYPTRKSAGFDLDAVAILDGVEKPEGSTPVTPGKPVSSGIGDGGSGCMIDTLFP